MEIELMSRVAQIIVLGPSFLGIAIDRPQCKGFRMRHSAQAQILSNIIAAVSFNLETTTILSCISIHRHQDSHLDGRSLRECPD